MRQPGALPRVEVVEPRRGPWTGNPAWGNRFQGAIPPVGFPTVVLQNDGIPGPPRALGVHLFRTDRSADSNDNAEVYAEISYGAGGVRNKFLVDWISGVQFGLVASAVTITAVPYVPDPTSAFVTNARIELGATLGLSPPAPAYPPTFTTPRTTIAAFGTTAIAIPDFARAVTAYLPGGIEADASFNFHRSFFFGATSTMGRGWTTAEMKSGAVLVPGGANVLQIQNSGAASMVAVVVFELAL